MGLGILKDYVCEVVDGEMVLGDSGAMVEIVWNELPGRFPNIDLDAFIIMPNHIHGIRPQPSVSPDHMPSCLLEVCSRVYSLRSPLQSLPCSVEGYLSLRKPRA